MTGRRLSFGFSPCPNDTFAFFAAVHGAVPMRGLELVPELADIETLNRRALDAAAKPLDVTKLSLPALAAAADRYAVLPAGAALGHGVGPLVVRRGDDEAVATLEHLRGRRVAIPGRHTTAFLLFTAFAPAAACECVEVRFEQVMPMVARGECDAGLVIHEGRFTYEQHGLVTVADLGQLWEQDTGLPLPLGVLVLRRELRALHAAVAGVLRDSVRFARSDPAAPRDYVRQHARELDDEVCARHIALYVNEFSVDLGARGRRAIDALLQRGRALGLLAAGPSPFWEEA